MTDNSAEISFTGAAGNRLAATRFGPDAGRVVLLLHGGGQTRHSWRNTAIRLAERGFTAIALDLRGHGDSEWVADQAYSFYDFADDVVTVAKEIAVRFGSRPIAVGASLGGLSSMLALSRVKGPLLDALVLVDITPRMNPDGVARIQGFMNERLHDGFASIEEASQAVSAYLPHREKPKSLTGLRKNLRQGKDGRWRWHWDPGFAEHMKKTRHLRDERQADLLAAAAAIDIPALLVRGGRSELVSEEHAREFLDLVPHARFADVTNAGHMVAGDRNDKFTDAVMAFLEDVSAPGE